jgi:hypothetical protein
MATNNSSNNQFTNDSDGFDISGGTTKRKLTVTAGDVTLSGGGSNTYTLPAASGTLITLKDVYPVGAVYFNASVSTDPGTVLGFGTWTTLGGYTLVGYNSGDSNFGTLGAVAAGEKTHTLTASESGTTAHSHSVGGGQNQFVHGGAGADATASITQTGAAFRVTAPGTGTDAATAASASSAHNNIQPSFVVYMWYRSA